MSDVDEVHDESHEAVDMTPEELEDWLTTDGSQAVGHEPGGSGESTGHERGRRIVDVLRTDEAERTDDDAAHMRKVVGHVERHTAQGPDEPDDELEHATWTASL